ncbi:hypothetical protein GCM10009665_38970 [Kitasatospora nipponensis]|uniref:Bro-N domain-containing protein n=1 Tax=Kitasatospora nipponensis TaxID=258049 RepID=A0ABP4H254_9ACTN
MDNTGMVLVKMSFPVTGQPIRVVMIDGEPWFVTADVCRILGRVNPSQTGKLLPEADTRVVDMHSAALTSSEGGGVSAGGLPYTNSNPHLNVVNESGLYTLIMRSRKPNAAPFQEWVTHDLLPSVRRGDTDVPTQRRRMAETLAEAVGQRVEVVAEVGREDLSDIRVHSDGTVHCPHGEMVPGLPAPGEDSGPPFGPFFACPAEERVGIRGSRLVPGCGRLKLVELARRLRVTPRADPAAPPPEPGPAPAGPSTADPAPEQVVAEIGDARIHGSPRNIAALLRFRAA